MKKITLRIICLALSAALCFSLAGCAPADERAFERACALMDAGEYEAAIEAFSAIGMYEQISEKIDEAQELLEEENMKFLYGDWVNIHTGALFTFSKGGKGSVSQDGRDTPFTYTSDGKSVDILAPVPLQLKVDKEEGVVHLKDQAGDYDLVPEKEYQDYLPQGPVTVEITLDNWQDYFEGRQAQDVGLDDKGDVNFREYGYGIFLKEEYIGSLDHTGILDVSFDVEYDLVPYLLEGDLNSDDYTLTEVRLPRTEKAPGKQQATMAVYDRGFQHWRSPESDLNNAVCGFISPMEVIVEKNEVYVLLVGNVTVTAASGSMPLLP